MFKVLNCVPLVSVIFVLQTPLRADDAITRQQADDILNELRQIRQLLEKQVQLAGPTARGNSDLSHARVNVQNRPFLGEKDAPLTIVEFTDYQCPFCRQFHLTTFNALKKNYIETGRMRFFSKDLPLDFHNNAKSAAYAARCADEQGQFWRLRDIMSANAASLNLPNIFSWAKSLSMDTEALRSCIDIEKYKNAVASDITEATIIGASGTPAFVIGKTTTDGTVEGQVVVGAQPYTLFDEKLKAIELLR
jgi:protein-disulfide isomerase